MLAELRRQGLSVAQLRQLLDTLRERFRVRLFEAIGPGGPITLLTDGNGVYARTPEGDVYNLLRDPLQPLLMIGADGELRELSSRTRRGKKRATSRSRGATSERGR